MPGELSGKVIVLTGRAIGIGRECATVYVREGGCWDPWAKSRDVPLWGQIHQHLVLFNHVALNHDVYSLGHIPHLQKHLVFPAQVIGGLYELPQEPGASTNMRLTCEGR